MRGRSFAAVLWVAVLLPFNAQSAEHSPALAELIAGAKAEGELNYIGGGGTIEGLKPVAEAMNRTYGVRLKISFTPGPSMPQLASRLMQESKAGKKASMDFFFGRPGHIFPMLQQEMLEPFPWARYFPSVTDKMLHYEGKIVTVGSKFNTGAVYNTRLVAKNEVPRKLDDVLNPKWKGKIAITPYAAGFSWVAMELGAVEKTLEYHRKLVKMAGGVTRDAEERVASGEFVMTVLEGNQSAERGKAHGLPVEWAMLEDFVGLNYSFMTVPKNSPHPRAARLFIGFLMTPEGQRLLWQHAKEDLYLVEGSRMSKLVKDAQNRGVRVVFDELSRMEDPRFLKTRDELDDKFIQQLRNP